MRQEPTSATVKMQQRDARIIDGEQETEWISHLSTGNESQFLSSAVDHTVDTYYNAAGSSNVSAIAWSYIM